jgi:hypothetical protein
MDIAVDAHFSRTATRTFNQMVPDRTHDFRSDHDRL